MPVRLLSRSCLTFLLIVVLGGSSFVAKQASAAEAIGKISLPPGFKAELVYDVPLKDEGSWVSLTVDDRGRLIASDESGALYRIEPAPLGRGAEKTTIQRLGISVGMAQGLLFHQGQLYVMQNGRIGGFSSGLYRVSDSNNDDRFDRIEQLRVFEGEGEHGPHAVVLGPDGKSLYLTSGNHTKLPGYSHSAPPPRWAEDQLLPRITDPRGHAATIKAPGGWIARTDLNGRNLELLSVGFRNTYDMAFNQDGELFTFDSDMEWDIGSPWYRPTRICHVTSGGDFGWRNGNGKWPDYYLDSLPAAVNVGPGSPTGVVFGKGARFPERYQQALFAADWSYGVIYAVHLTPHGSSYTGVIERFASAMPLGVTDMIVRPQDGAMYFTVGGRKSKSAIYRIVWSETDNEPNAAETTVAAADQAGEPIALPPEEGRALRHSLEKLHAGATPGAVEQLWPHLGSPDRFISNAARVALEHQPLSEWRQRALSETRPETQFTALAAFARTADSGQQLEWATALARTNFSELNRTQRLMALRAAALGVMRLEPLQPATREKLLSAFDPYLPTGDHQVDRQLGDLLVRLRAPGAVDRLLALLEGAASQEDAIELAVTLSAARDGWTVESRGRLLEWFQTSSRLAGGASFFGYLTSARDRFIAGFTPTERTALRPQIEKPLAEQPPQIQVESRPFVKEWKLDEVVSLVEQQQGARDFENGRKMFSAAGCFNCHRIAGTGSSIGPDLTGVGGRFGVPDLVRSMVEPNFTISDQYQQMVFETNGRIIVGRVTNLLHDTIMVSTNMLDPKKTETIERKDLDDQYPSDVSMMPSGLLNTLTAEDILDLTAFLRSGGNPDHDLFRAAEGQ